MPEFIVYKMGETNVYEIGETNDLACPDSVPLFLTNWVEIHGKYDKMVGFEFAFSWKYFVFDHGTIWSSTADKHILCVSPENSSYSTSQDLDSERKEALSSVWQV